MKNKKKLVLFLAIITIIVLGLQAWDDEKLFTTIKGGKGKSNVILIQDRTGSMCSIIYHPDFNPTDSSVDVYSNVSITSASRQGLTQTSWYIRGFTAPATITGDVTYAIAHTFTSTGATTGTLLVGPEGISFKVGDWILQYDPSDENDINEQAFARITAISGPGSAPDNFFTLTLADIQGDFVHDYRLHVCASNATIYNYDSSNKYLRITGDIRNYFNINDYIMLYDRDNPHTTSRQVMARITAETYTNGRTVFTLTDIRGTIDISSTGQDRVFYRVPSEMRLVKLYGSVLDQGDYNVSYDMEQDSRYLSWIFGKANAAQRQQVTDFSTLAYDIEYNSLLIPTTDPRYPVTPVNAFALNPDNSNSSETLLSEWNRVMKSIYPNKIANLKNDATAASTTIIYEKHKASLAGYTTPGFKIKIDAETMLVNSNVIDTDGKWGTLTVTRAQDNTVAATHPAGAAIMIYDQNTPSVIAEFVPLTHLFSSMQHVTEATGDVDPTYTEHRTEFLPHKDCYRYKRVFTRIQVAREALCDVITAKNKLFKVADLAAAASDVATDLTYLNANPDFLTRVAPFYIKVSDPDNPLSDEIMRVTAHDPLTYTLTVTRAQQGTSACAHTADSIIMAYSGARDLVRFGIFYFPVSSTSQLLVGLNDFGQKNSNGTYKAAAYINTTILDQVNQLNASGATPLARALSKVWNYLKPNPGTGTTDYIKTGSGDWKAVDISTFSGISYDDRFEPIDGVSHPRGSPMEYWCQENYAVMITDGLANDDGNLRDYPVFSNSITKTSVAGSIINDFYKFDYNYSSPTPWGDTLTEGSEYLLTDVAYFLSHQDMFPTKRILRLANNANWNTTNKIFTTDNPVSDPALYNETNTDPRKQWPGNQNIKTYTVGLCFANDVLPKAAKNGGGANFTVSNYRDLSEAFLNIITSVELAQDPMTYTTYAAPKQSITGGNYGYIAHFVPRPRAIWEGHLRRYRLADDGSFPDNIDNPAATVSVKSGDDMVDVVSFQWDAGAILNTRTTARIVYTSKPFGSSWQRYDFMGSSIDAADLDVTAGQVTQVKNFIQNFNKADGIDANSEYKGLYRLGETFHFNPQLVGYPLAWKANFDVSYKSFYERYATGGTARSEVVYAGANDGKLHCFDALSGSELWSYVPYSHLKKLKIPALNPSLATAHTYFIDGKSLVKDIKVAKTDGTFYNDYRDWKTGLFFGMGIGGRSYCALDVSDPKDNLKILWETNESAESVANGNMGFTEAKPVVVDMNGGSTIGNFPAVILVGGYNAAEVQATDVAALDWQRREGKALYILNANSGALIKKFIYGTALADTGNASSGYVQTNPGFLTAMTAAPAVLDKNNDGYADVIYLAESGDYRISNAHGGAIWKINCYGDPSTWVAQKIYQAPAGQTIFVSPSLAYDTDYRVWVMFGTGRRPRPVEGSSGVFTNLTGQFVAFIDDGSGTTKTNADLFLAEETSGTETTVKEGTYTIDDSGTVKKGFYFNFLRDSEIMYEPQPLYINKQVLFMTFTPQEGAGSSGSTDDPCGGSSAANGSHYIYQFELNAQGNTFSISGFLSQAGKILGYGPMDDKFIIYQGAGDAGNFKPNEGAGGKRTFDMSDPESGMFWKEDKK